MLKSVGICYVLQQDKNQDDLTVTSLMTSVPKLDS